MGTVRAVPIPLVWSGGIFQGEWKPRKILGRKNIGKKTGIQPLKLTGTIRKTTDDNNFVTEKLSWVFYHLSKS